MTCDGVTATLPRRPSPSALWVGQHEALRKAGAEAPWEAGCWAARCWRRWSPGRLDSVSQPLWLRDPAGLGSKLVGRAPGSADSGGLGGAWGRAGYGHTLFPNRCLLPDIPRQLLSSRNRPMQSLSRRLEAGITLAAPWDESAASRAQQGLPRSPGPGQLPVTRPAPLFPPGRQPSPLAPRLLAQRAPQAPHQLGSDFPDARLAHTGAGAGFRRPVV